MSKTKKLVSKRVLKPLMENNINEFIYMFVLIAEKQSSLPRAMRRHIVLEVKKGIKWGWIKVEGQDIWNALASKEKPEPMNVEQKEEFLEQNDV